MLASGVPVTVVTSTHGLHGDGHGRLLDTVAAVPNRYARKIVATHRTAPLTAPLAEGHLKVWDELAALCLFAPELFTVRQITPTTSSAARSPTRRRRCGYRRR